MCISECCNMYIGLLVISVVLLYVLYYIWYMMIIVFCGKRMNIINDIGYVIIDVMIMFLMSIEGGIIDMKVIINY